MGKIKLAHLESFIYESYNWFIISIIRQNSNVAKLVDDISELEFERFNIEFLFQKLLNFQDINGNSCLFPLFNLRLKESLLGRLF